MVNIKIFDPQFRLTLHFCIVADFICWYDVHVCIIQALGGPREAPCPAAATPGPAKEVEGPAHTVEPKDPVNLSCPTCKRAFKTTQATTTTRKFILRTLGPRVAYLAGPRASNLAQHTAKGCPHILFFCQSETQNSCVK